MADPSLHDRSFTWPPVRADAKAAEARARQGGGQGAAAGSGALLDKRRFITERAQRWWRAVESAWLDPTALPLALRAEETGWGPDALAKYCDRCGHTIGPHESSEFGCSACAHTRPPWARFVRLGEYDSPLSDWVCEVKFQRFRALGHELGRSLARSIRVACAGIDLSARAAVVVPVPTTLRRRIERGIDHAGVIAQAVASELGLPMRRALVRDHRPSQRAVPVSDRAGNVSNSIRLARVAYGPGQFWFRSGRGAVKALNVILIDDVVTTGATLRAAVRAVGEARRTGDGPAAVIAAVLAVTPEPGRRPGGHGTLAGPESPEKA